MNVKEHYGNHLASFYSWMCGDFSIKCEEFKSFLSSNNITPHSTGVALDLGSGHGIQSIPLAEIGFSVVAVDFSSELLNELAVNGRDLNITTFNDDIRRVQQFTNKAELIVCCGDTLSHLDNKLEVKAFISQISHSIIPKGVFILSFRDYSIKLTGLDRFISVKCDDNRILTCILEYEEESVHVTDLLYEKTNGVWEQKTSTYTKVRLLTEEVVGYLKENGMTIKFNKVINRLTTIIAYKD